jgi:uncharacterized membrane protein YkoI
LQRATLTEAAIVGMGRKTSGFLEDLLMNRTIVSLVTVALALGLYAAHLRAAEDEAKEHENARKALPKTTVTLSQAIRAALQKFPNAKAVEAELEVDGDNFHFEVEVVNDDGQHKILTIDPANGQVTKVEDESAEKNKEGNDDEQAENEISRSKVSLNQAVETALSRSPGAKAFEAEPERDQGRLLYEVELLTADNRVLEILIDPTSREVVKLTPEQP